MIVEVSIKSLIGMSGFYDEMQLISTNQNEEYLICLVTLMLFSKV